MTPALALEHVTCTFASREGQGQRYTAVRDTSIAVAEGEFVSVVGPTGCGKSTLLNVAAGLLQPSAGKVRVLGEPLGGINAKAGYMASNSRASTGASRNAALLNGWRASASPASRSAIRTSSRAGCASAWRWRRSSSSIHGCC
jgi:ABC-type glutathione transport system ATPase component